MEIRTLEYFLAVAREENMTEAANVLHVTQPTLSRQIADLERELGTRLFTRTNRSTVLTEDGMRLRQRAEEILSLVDQTKEELAEGAENLTGTIRLGGGVIRAMKSLTDLFARFHARHPRTKIEFVTGNADHIEERLTHGLIDFALLIEPVSLEKYEYVRLPAQEPVGIITSATGPWAKYDAITPGLLKKIPLSLPSRRRFASYDFAGWSRGAVTPEKLSIIGWHDLFDNVAFLVAAGTVSAAGLNVLPEGGAKGLKFIPLSPPLAVTCVIAWKKYRLLGKTSEKFLEELQKGLAGAGQAGNGRGLGE